MIARLVEFIAVAGANCASFMYAYQPKLPKCLV